MTLTDDQLRIIMPALSPALRQQYLPHLQTAMDEFGINTPLRAAAFLAQLAHESAQLTRLIENLNYSAQGLLKIFPKYFPTSALAQSYARQPERIANRVYASRLGNGPESSGDGWRYRGRGAIQITGRENYRTYGDMIGTDLVTTPEQAASGEVAFRTAGAFWKSKGCNELADRQDFITITKRVNGGLNGLADRQQFYERAKRALGAGGVSRSAQKSAAKKSSAKKSAAKKPATKKAAATKSSAKKGAAKKQAAKKGASGKKGAKQAAKKTSASKGARG